MKNDSLNKRKKIDLLTNIVAQIPLTISLVGAPFLESLHNSQFIDNTMLSSDSPSQLSLNFLLGIGIASIGGAMKHYNDSTQLKKLWEEEPQVLDEGAHSLIRHPTYLAQRIMAAGGAIMWPGIYSAGALLGHLGITEYLSRREEKTCELEYGEDYSDYKKKTPRWIPSVSNVLNKFRSAA